jgi:metallophosphoesterase superfamily enzyme
VHLGYAEARRRDGDAVPIVGVAQALAPLRHVIERHSIHRLVVAGDLFEDGPSPELVDELHASLRTDAIELVALVPGNHDRDVAALSAIPVYPGGYDLNGWNVIHGDGKRTSAPSIQGHEHPLSRWANGLTAPCYLVCDDHIVLPAFSTDAAGVNVLTDGRWSAHRCVAIAGDHLLDFGAVGAIRPGRRTARC